MADLPAATHEILAKQHGAASIRDLLDAGMTRSSINDVVRRGGLELVIPGAYRTPSVAVSELQRCVALSRARPDLVVAGPTAGRLMGLRRLPTESRIHVIAPPGSHPSIEDWVVPFRTPTIGPDEIIERPDGIRILALPRLALDLSRFVNDLDLGSIIEQCLLDGGHSADEMYATAIDWMSPRRRWVRRFVEALDRRIDGPPAESHLEVIIGDRLRSVGVVGLVRQHWIRPAEHRPIRFDLAVPNLRWAIEIDGFPTHRELAGARADRRRDRAAQRLGWLVRRVGPNDIGEALDSTIAFLAADVVDRACAS